jgi:hypothetical protein
MRHKVLDTRFSLKLQMRRKDRIRESGPIESKKQIVPRDQRFELPLVEPQAAH